MISRPLSRTAIPVLTMGAIFLMPHAYAQTVAYNNFGAGNSFSNSSGWDLGGPTAPLAANVSFGFGFTPSITGALTGLDVAIGHFGDFGGANGGVQVFISTSAVLPNFPATGVIPAALESWSITGPLPAWNSNFAPQSLTSVNKPTLSAGTVYFIYAKSTGSTWNRWQFNTTGDSGTVIRSSNNSTYGDFSPNTKGAFRVTVTPAPEPGTLSLLALGACAVLIARRRKTA